MNKLKWKVIVGVVGLTVLSIGTVARGQSTEAKPEISNEQLIKQLQAQIEQLQTIIKTQETEIQHLKALCKKAGIETKPMEKELRIGGGILEFYQKYKNKYALLDGKYIFFSNFDIKYSNSRKGQHPENYKSYTEWMNDLRKYWEDHREENWRFLDKISWEKYKEQQEHKSSLELPKWAVGEYGRFEKYFFGLKIFQILGPDEMLIVYNEYNESKTARFKGWSTKNLIDGQSWDSNKENADSNEGIAIVGTYRYKTTFGTTKTILNVVPLDLFRKGITLEQFKVMLEKNNDLPEDLQRLKTKFLR